MASMARRAVRLNLGDREQETPDWIRWWVICGDVPTDYISAAEIKHPRDAMKAFADEWRDQAKLMASGQRQPDIYIGRPEHWASLAPLVEARASMLFEGVNDDSLWEN